MTAISEDARYTTEELAQRFPQGVPVEIIGYLFQNPAADRPMSEVRKEVERMANIIEARRGTISEDVRERALAHQRKTDGCTCDECLDSFAALILSEREAAQREATAAERDRCAKVVEAHIEVAETIDEEILIAKLAAAILQEPKE